MTLAGILDTLRCSLVLEKPGIVESNFDNTAGSGLDYLAQNARLAVLCASRVGRDLHRQPLRSFVSCSGRGTDYCLEAVGDPRPTKESVQLHCVDFLQ